MKNCYNFVVEMLKNLEKHFKKLFPSRCHPKYLELSEYPDYW